MKRSWISRLKLILLYQNNCVLKNEQINSFIPGIYEREYKYGNVPVKDTLTIRRLSEVTDLFQVDRQVIGGPVEGAEGAEKVSRTERWIAAYHLPTRQLIQGVSHKIFSFSPESDVLYFENKQFWKTAILGFDPGVWQ
jgi:hypothetical protein